MRHPPPKLAARWLLAGFLTLLAGVYVGRTLDHGWVAHDEGTLGQSAARVAAGELPHRDFDDVYTGGLAEVNAAAYRAFGARLSIMRWIVFAVFLASVPATFYIASRFVGPWAAAGTTIVAIVWGLPNYPAALPSWYNLFFAIFALAALLRFVDTGRRRWLVVCGAAIGVSMAIKIVGMYVLAAVLLVLLWHEQSHSPAETADGEGGRLFGVCTTTGLAVFGAALVLLVHHADAGGNVRPLIHFALPGIALALALIAREWRRPHAPTPRRIAHFAALVAPTLLGVAIPLLLFFVPYLATGAVRQLIDGVFVAPTRRLHFATQPLPTLRAGWPIVPLALTLAAAALAPRRWRWIGAAILGAGAVVLLTATVAYPTIYRHSWGATELIIPVTALAGVPLLERLGAADGERLLAVLATAALVSLVQFPFAAPIYFCYAAPLAVVAVVATIATLPPNRSPGPVGGVVLAYFAALAVFFMNGQGITALGAQPVGIAATARLPVADAGLFVPPDDSALYTQVIALVHAHAGPSDYVYAAPDCPEISVLAGLKSPTRTLYDFFDTAPDRERRVLDAIARHDVRVVVVNDDPEFSDPLSPGLDSALTDRFPNDSEVGRFTIRWR